MMDAIPIFNKVVNQIQSQKNLTILVAEDTQADQMFTFLKRRLGNVGLKGKEFGDQRMLTFNEDKVKIKVVTKKPPGKVIILTVDPKGNIVNG
jgi:hypothetical protein